VAGLLESFCVRDRKLEVGQSFSQQGADICLLNETYLKSCRTLRFTDCLAPDTDGPIMAAGTALLVRKGRGHHALPVSGMQHLEATSIHPVLAPDQLIPIGRWTTPCANTAPHYKACLWSLGQKENSVTWQNTKKNQREKRCCKSCVFNLKCWILYIRQSFTAQHS
jgi:hypothetical protein